MSMKRSEIRGTAKTRLWLKQLLLHLHYARKISNLCLLFAYKNFCVEFKTVPLKIYKLYYKIKVRMKAKDSI